MSFQAGMTEACLMETRFGKPAAVAKLAKRSEKPSEAIETQPTRQN